MTVITGQEARLEPLVVQQLFDLEQLMSSQSYLGGDAHTVTLNQQVNVSRPGSGDRCLIFPVGSALTRMKDGSVILQHPAVGRVEMPPNEPDGTGVFHAPGR